MKDIYNSKTEFNDIFRRIQKNSFYFEGFCISIRQSFTNNTFYYFLSLIFRFVPLLLLSGGYFNIFKINFTSKSFHKYIKLLTLYHYANHFNLSYEVYFGICILIYFLLIIRILCYSYIIKKLKNYEFTPEWSILDKYRTIYDHILLLIFPYIIEFLSFSYYIFFSQINLLLK